MKRQLHPAKKVGGSVSVPGDKSIAHRAALLSILADSPIEVKNFPDGADCQSSLDAARALGVTVEQTAPDQYLLTPGNKAESEENQDTLIDCGNSGTTARLLAGLLSGSQFSAILSGDESLSARPMARVIDPLTAMGGDLSATEGHLPLTVRGKKLLPFEYRLPVPSAQVKSALLLAGVATGCSVTVQEDELTRDHTELMLAELGAPITVRNIKAVPVADEHDPRRKRMVRPEPFKRETILGTKAKIAGGSIDIPGDASTAAFFLAVGALGKTAVTVTGMGLNPTRMAFLDHLKTIGCSVDLANKTAVNGEVRGDVSVTGSALKSRKLQGARIVGLIDEIPIVAVLAALSEGTTIIRDASELKVKESDRLAATAHNLTAMGVSCGLLDDGLAIEGCKELNGADLKSFGDHRIAMAFAIASLFAVGPSTIDDVSVIDISCPTFFTLLAQVAK